MTYERRHEINDIMYNTIYWSGEKSKYEVSEDIYWLWYDTEECETVEERDNIYEVVENYLILEGIL